MRIETGIDIIEIERIKQKFQHNNKFLHLVFTENEIKQVENKNIMFQTLAGKWASKEAFSKALGTGIGKDLHWLDIEISNDINGKPIITVKKHIIEKFNIQNISLSISHSKDTAIANCLIVFS